MQPRNAGSPCRPWAIISPFVSNRAQLKSQASVTMREKAVRSSVTCASSTMVSSLFHHMVSVVASSAGVFLTAIDLSFQRDHQHAQVVDLYACSGRDDRWWIHDPR